MQDGDIFTTVNSGDLEILNYVTAKNVTVRFIKTGTEKTTCSINIKRGNVKDYFYPAVYGVGFLGEGQYKPRGSDKHASIRWKGMLERCYSDRYQALKPTYIGCVVCDEWHNFQNFAEWFYNNHIDGFELDKDKLGNGKLYSPDTCCFISRAENVEISQAQHYKFTHKDHGTIDVFNLSKFCREFGLTRANMHKVINGARNHHKGWTIYE
tara:strand:- start:1166 stop:1795 length:630 start_codon:yes stop_codon:yes gene_type:complete